jgi:apolipoprotein N-acyltransferase
MQVNDRIASRDEALWIGKGVLASLFSASLLIFCFPQFDFGFLAWIALVPLFIGLKDKSLTCAFGLSFLTGITFLMGVFYWINVIHGFELTHFILLGLYFGSYFGLFGLTLNLISQKAKLPTILSAPCLWVSFEYLRAHADFLGLPWALLGHSQYLNVPVIQIASLTGVYGISFLIVMVNAAMSEVFLSWVFSRSSMRMGPGVLKCVTVAIFVLGISLAYGFSVTANNSANDKIKVTVIQGNIAQEIRWEREYLKRNLERHIGLTREAASGGNTSLIVWPETSVQGSLTQDLYLLTTLSALAKETQTNILVGSAVRPKFGSREFRIRHWFNSAFLISSGGRIVGKYDKIKLLPFAEYLPYKETFPWPETLVSKAANFIPGKEYTLFNVNGANFGVMICWESIFPDLFRNAVNSGANFMVNITNEAWFGKTAAPYQFIAMNVFRAVENRISIARAANTGISGFIDPSGKILGTVKDGNQDIFVKGYLTMDIPVLRQRTFYTLYGDIFAYLNLAMTSISLLWSVLKTKSNAVKLL